MATLPATTENIDQHYGPHLSASIGTRLDTSVVPDKVVETHCCFCGQQCGIKLLVKDNNVIGFEPWMEFPFNQGKLCPKGVKRYLQGAHPDRLSHALQRDPVCTGRLQTDRLMYKAADILEKKFDQIGEEMTREEGKTLPEAKGEVRRAINIFRYFARRGLAHGRRAWCLASATACTCSRSASRSAWWGWSRRGISRSRFRRGRLAPALICGQHGGDEAGVGVAAERVADCGSAATRRAFRRAW